MEDIPVFEIKSYKGTYEVDIVDFIPSIANKGDIFVIDDYIYDQYYRDRYIEDNEVFIVEATEEAKTLDGVEKLLDFMIKNEFRKNNRLFAVGGGVIQDLVSFTASIYSRGVEWVFYPTTLLAQCDSCIGSKTSINYKGSKNKLGGFHPPREILINREFLNTLSECEIKSGIGEMLHYFLLNHEIEIAEKMVNDKNFMANINEYISKSLAIKKEMIEKDEFDQSERNLFNYGHTFGHAIESISNYEVNHGQAVTRGMRIANRISLENRKISQLLYDKLEEILIKNDTDYMIRDVDAYIEALKKDKKNTSNKLTCILLNQNYGEKAEIYYEQVRDVLQWFNKPDPPHVIDFMI
jgi:3-dehydroquinate synthase